MAKKTGKKKTRVQSSPSEASVTDDQAVSEAAAGDAPESPHGAQGVYARARERGAGKVAKARAVTVGDVLDSTLEFVRRHPAAGVLAAAAVGYLLGRTKGR